MGMQKWHLWGMAVALAASIIGLGLIVVTTGPDTASSIIKILFFLSLFIALWSAATLVLALLRLAFSRAFFLGFLAAFLALATILVRRLL